MRGLVVTGTSTGVGKTQVARAILTMLRDMGERPAPFKPAETGCAEPTRPEDALALREAAASDDPLELVCPYRLRDPLAPAEAAEHDGVRIDPERLLACARALGRGDRFVLVESAGGVYVPFAPGFTFLDLARALRLPVVVVAADALGTLNHTALTVKALAGAGLDVRGVVLNATSPADDGTRASNARWVSELCGVEVIAKIPFESDASSRLARAREALGRKFDALLSRR